MFMVAAFQSKCIQLGGSGTISVAHTQMTSYSAVDDTIVGTGGNLSLGRPVQSSLSPLKISVRAGVSVDVSLTPRADNEPKEMKKGWEMAVLAKCLPYKHEGLNSTSSTHVKNVRH